MELTEYSLARAEEHRNRVMNRKYWPYHVVVSGIYEPQQWCYKNLKGRNWRNRGSYFAFKRQQDAMMFTLRWS